MRDRGFVMQRLCLEAVRRSGADFQAIEAYIRERLEALSEDEKSRLKEEIARVLSFRPPAPGTGSLH